MSADARTVPHLAQVHLRHSSNYSVPLGGYPSLDAADAAVTRAFAGYEKVAHDWSETITVWLLWSDRHQSEEHLRLGPTDLAAAAAAGQGLLRYLLVSRAKADVTGTTGIDFAPYVVEQRRQRGRDLLRRLIADDAARRNARTTPRVVRVVLSTIKDGVLHRYVFDSIANADAKLGEVFATAPADDERAGWAGGVVYWSDGYELQARFYVTREHVVNAQADGGLLRHALLRDARLEAARSSYKGVARDVAARRIAQGKEMLARIEADALDAAHRNAAASAWTSYTLMPNPAETIRRLRDRFAGRRIVEARGEADDDEPGNGTGYPATNHSDVQYVSNYVSVALRNDLRAFDEVTTGVIWNHWCAVRDTIETLLRSGDDTDEYRDNEGFWTRQLPALVQLLDDALTARRAPRNGRLTFRAVGRRGEDYPPWVADLRGRSGVYIIREPGETGDLEIVYVGSSSADRLQETLTRHFQSWRRYKGFWRGGFTEGHDPGLTYNRDTAEAAVIVTPAHHALELERRLIGRLRPRDNLVGQVAEEEVPF